MNRSLVRLYIGSVRGSREYKHKSKNTEGRCVAPVHMPQVHHMQDTHPHTRTPHTLPHMH